MKHLLAYKVSFTTILLLIFAYRFYILFTYGAHRIDEDQALMWYGTTSFFSGGIAEPHFLGQMYGSMLESVVALPFYYIGIPLNYAVPIGTIVLWIVPFIICSFYAVKRNALLAYFILLSSLLYNYDYDIVTNIPRSFLSGFAFSIAGIVLLLEETISIKCRMLFCPILLSVAYICTDTTLATSCLGVFYFIIYKTKIHESRMLFIGIEIGIFLVLLCNRLFYINNIDYFLHYTVPFYDVSFEIFKQNFYKINLILQSFSILNISHVPLGFLVLAFSIIMLTIHYKDYKMFSVLLALLFGTLLVLSLSKSLDYADKISYSQARLFIYFPYCIALYLYFLSINNVVTRCDFQNFYGYISALTIIIFVFKVWTFNYALNHDRYLYRMYLKNATISTLTKTAQNINNYAKRHNCNIVVILGINPLVGYSSAALNFGKYESYNAYYDRRTKIYKRFRDREINECVMFVHCRSNQVDKIDIAHISGNLINYISQEYKTDRRIINDCWINK